MYHDQFTVFSDMDNMIPTCKSIIENYESKHKEIYSRYTLNKYKEESETMINQFMRDILLENQEEQF